MKLRKTGWFLAIYLLVCLVTDWLLATYMCIPYGCPCPGGRCAVPYEASMFFVILNIVFLVMGIVGYLYLKKKK